MTERINATTGFVVFHVVLTGHLACPLTHARPDTWLRCVVCDLYGPREVRTGVTDYERDPRD